MILPPVAGGAFVVGMITEILRRLAELISRTAFSRPQQVVG